MINGRIFNIFLNEADNVVELFAGQRKRFVEMIGRVPFFLIEHVSRHADPDFLRFGRVGRTIGRKTDLALANDFPVLFHGQVEKDMSRIMKEKIKHRSALRGFVSRFGRQGGCLCREKPLEHRRDLCSQVKLVCHPFFVRDFCKT